MRKFIVITIILSCLIFTSGCKENNIYIDKISELRQDVYTGSSDELNITANYGFKENPFIINGKVSELIYGYTFKLHVIPDEIKRCVEFSDGDKTYSAVFELDDITSEYKAFIETKTHFEKQFTIRLISGTDVKNVALTSVLPENTIVYKKALEILTEKQRPLFDAYTVNGEFNAEIFMRIFVKDLKPYWYIAIANSENKLKAMLIEGFSGELLAVKDVF